MGLTFTINSIFLKKIYLRNPRQKYSTIPLAHIISYCFTSTYRLNFEFLDDIDLGRRIK